VRNSHAGLDEWGLKFEKLRQFQHWTGADPIAILYTSRREPPIKKSSPEARNTA
jgi:hypothetical protein